MRWETDPDEQNFTDLMGTEYVKAELWWPHNGSPPQYSIRIEIKQRAEFSGVAEEGIAAAEAALRTAAQAIIVELGGRVTWEKA